MPLPTVICPNCNARFSLEAVFAHEGARELMLQLVDAYPGASRLLRPLLRYIGLFAPGKNEMGFDRVSRLLAELVPAIRAARIERHGRTWVAPLETWIAALEQVLANRDAGKLALPLKSHGYLLEIVAGLAGGQEARTESAREQRLRSGQRDLQARDEAQRTLQDLAERAAAQPPAAPREVPADAKQALQRLGIGRRRSGGEP